VRRRGKASSAESRSTCTTTPRYRALGLTALCAALLTLAFSATPAFAIHSHQPPASYPFPGVNGPNDVAIDQTNHVVYVDNAGGSSITKYDTAGNPQNFSALAASAISIPGSVPYVVAVDNSGGANNGDIYISDLATTTVYKFLPNGNPDPSTPQIGAGILTEPSGVDVDASGDIFVVNYNTGVVDEFGPAGNHLTSFGTPAAAPEDLALDSSGKIYIAAHNGTFEFNSTGTCLNACAPLDPYLDLGVAVDASDNVYVADLNNTTIDEYDSTGNPLESFGSSEDFGGAAHGLAIDGVSGAAYVATAAGIQVYTSETPEVTINPPSNVGQTSVTLNANVDPAGHGDVTDCRFERGTDTSYGTNAACLDASDTIVGTNANPITVPTDVHTDVSGLQTETTYHYRLVVSNAKLTGATSDQTFTLHAVAALSTDPATNVARNRATLNGSFNGDGDDTHYYFEWGTDTTYGNTTAVPPGTDAGPVSGPQSPSFALSGLEGETTYHYRIVASNSVGTSYGQDMTFVTPVVKDLSTDPATDVTLTGATLNGSLDPDGLETHYRFEYGIDTSYGQTSATSDLADDAPAGSVPGIPITGLSPNHTYHYRIVATNSINTVAGADQSFTTPSTPLIDAFSSSNVTAISADLNATINPLGFDTTYHFEYGPTPTYGTSIPIPEASVGSGSTDQLVSVHLSDLQGVTYHFRIVATNKWGTTTSGDQTFNFFPPSCPNAAIRQQTNSSYLPDCRAYELVSAADAGGTALFPDAPTSAVATSPARLAYGGVFGTIPGAGDAVNLLGDVYVATRTGTGWVTKYTGIPATQAIIVGGPFLPNSTLPRTGGVLADLSMDKIMDWNGGYPAFALVGPDDLGSLAPYLWSSDGDSLGRLPTNLADVAGGGTLVGDVKPSPDFTHYFFSSNNVAFASGGLTSAPGSAYDNDIATGTVTIVSKTPPGADIPQDAGDSTEFINFPAVSTDGSHILMSTAAPAGTVHLYMRVNDAITYDVSVGQDALNHGVTFVGMTPDGSKAYFTSDEQLTADDHDTSTDLLMWGEATNSLTRISAGDSNAASSAGDTDACAAVWVAQCGAAEVPTHRDGLFIGGPTPPTDNAVASANGDIYFYSPEQLDGFKGVTGQQNLYVYRNGQVQYVTTLAPGSPAVRIQVSPDDSHAAFVTASQLTPYDNAGHTEMYSYTPSTGELLCVSCIPSGAPPTTEVQASQNGIFMSDDGRTFFSTGDALVPPDTDRRIDIYEHVDGRPQLISSGTTSRNSGSMQFVPIGLDGVSADGVNVYFSTTDTLVGQDRNGPFMKFYDARTGGGFAFVPPSAPCAAADECHGPGSTPPAQSQIGTAANLGAAGNAHTKAQRKRHKAKHNRPRRKGKHHKQSRNKRHASRRQG
jgi:hypothetical protein